MELELKQKICMMTYSASSADFVFFYQVNVANQTFLGQDGANG
jgi:hypothetical protein